jgi:predicted lactoylglutathione lyase
MEQRVSLITLGVGDLDRARAFYEQLGWKASAEPDGDIVFFQAGGLVFALWDRGKLAADSGVADNGGWGGVALGYCADSPATVDTLLAQAQAAGAVITRPAAQAFWGGYAGMFVDPDGHPWEVAHNPFWTLHADGSVTLAP